MSALNKARPKGKMAKNMPMAALKCPYTILFG
jgi:hypothetical protein